MKLSLTFFVAPVALLALACGGSTDGATNAPEDSSEDALSTRQLSNVVAIEFEMNTPGPGAHQGAPSVRKVTIGAKSKVSKAIRSFKRVTANDPMPLCHPSSTRTSMKFYDAKGEVVATGGYLCMRGSIEMEGREPFRFKTSSGELGDILEQPLVPADVLWGIDKVQITKHQAVGTSEPGEVNASGEDVSKILDAMDIEQEIDLNHMGTRCRPTHTLAFVRKNKDVAYSSYVCHLDSPFPTSITSRFTAPNPDNDDENLVAGGIKINPRKIEAVYDAHR